MLFPTSYRPHGADDQNYKSVWLKTVPYSWEFEDKHPEVSLLCWEDFDYRVYLTLEAISILLVKSPPCPSVSTWTNYLNCFLVLVCLVIVYLVYAGEKPKGSWKFLIKVSYYWQREKKSEKNSLSCFPVNNCGYWSVHRYWCSSQCTWTSIAQ